MPNWIVTAWARASTGNWVTSGKMTSLRRTTVEGVQNPAPMTRVSSSGPPKGSGRWNPIVEAWEASREASSPLSDSSKAEAWSPRLSLPA